MISLFSPLYSQKASSDWGGCLQSTTHFFNFGQPAYIIRYYEYNTAFVCEKLNSKPSWIGILLRVAAFCTVIIPLIMLMGLLIYRGTNRFMIDESRGIHKLSDRLVKHIFEKSDPASILELKGTCKLFKEIIEEDHSLNRTLIAFEALKQSHRELRKVRTKDTAWLQRLIIETLSLFYPEKALSMADGMISLEAKKQTLASVARAFMAFNINKTIVTTYSLDQDKRDAVLLEAAKKIVQTDPRKAFHIADMMSTDYGRLTVQSVILKAAILLNPQRVLHLLERSIQGMDYAKLSASHKACLARRYAKIILLLDPLRAKEMAEMVKIKALDVVDRVETCAILTKFIKVIGPLEEEETDKMMHLVLDLVTAMDNKRHQLDILLKLADSLVISCHLKSVQIIQKIIAITIQSTHLLFKNKAICSLASIAVKLEKESALKVLEMLINQAIPIQNSHPEALISAIWALGHFDKKQSLEWTEIALIDIQENNNKIEKSKMLSAIMTLLSSFNYEESENLIKRMVRIVKKFEDDRLNNSEDSKLFDSIVANLAKIDPQKALEMAGVIKNSFRKSLTIALIAKSAMI